MHNMSDIIEQYIKKLFEESNEDVVEIQRANIAQRFDCVPSQLNYVIKTRFTNEHGYEIESKRGGGGYIRITKIENKDATGYINHLLQIIGPSISQQQAYYILDGLLDKGLISEREARMIQVIVDRETLKMDVVARDIIRANILKRLLPIINFINRKARCLCVLCENCHLNEAEVKLTVKEGTSEKWVCSICAQGENPWQQNETPSPFSVSRRY